MACNARYRLTVLEKLVGGHPALAGGGADQSPRVVIHVVPQKTAARGVQETSQSRAVLVVKPATAYGMAQKGTSSDFLYKWSNIHILWSKQGVERLAHYYADNDIILFFYSKTYIK